MNAQGSKRLSGTLGKPDIGQRRLIRSVQDVVDGVGDIVEGEVVDREIPELGRVGRVMNRLLRVFVATVVSELSIVSLQARQARGNTVRTHTS